MFDFDTAVREWSNPPVDDVGYLPSSEMLEWDDDKFRAMVEAFETTRYDLHGYRNVGNLWRDCLGLDTTHGKHILDFGCGVGIEALQLARAGNRITLVDLSPENLAVAHRTLSLYGYEPEQMIQSGSEPTSLDSLKAKVDVFFANGVMHHLPNAGEWMAYVAQHVLVPGGEARLLLYSDHGWTTATGTEVPGIEDDVTQHPSFLTFVQYFDGVGTHADWYNINKINLKFGKHYNLKAFDYITSDQRYLVTKLET